MSQTNTTPKSPGPAPAQRRAPKIYTEHDLKAAEAEVWKLTSDQEFRGRRPNSYRAALKSAMEKVQTIKNSLGRVKPGA